MTGANKATLDAATPLQKFNAIMATVIKYHGLDPDCAEWADEIRAAIEGKKYYSAGDADGSPTANTGDALSRAVEIIFGFIGRQTQSGKLNPELFNAALSMKAALAPLQVDTTKLDIHIVLNLLFEAAKGESIDPEQCELIERIAKDYAYNTLDEKDVQALYECGHRQVDVETMRKDLCGILSNIPRGAHKADKIVTYLSARGLLQNTPATSDAASGSGTNASLKQQAEPQDAAERGKFMDVEPLRQSIQNGKDTLQYCADELNDAEWAAVSEYANSMSYADLRRIIEAAERGLIGNAEKKST